jgi:hypothetical protein
VNSPRRLALIVGTGTVMRVAWAIWGHGGGWDIGSLTLVRNALGVDAIHVYRRVNLPTLRWPYPPGYFAWVATAGAVATASGMRFSAVVKLLPIAADAGIAWLSHRAVLRNLGDAVMARRAAAVVSFGPLFATISGYHGQLDSVAILPALAALDVWQRRGERLGRAVLAGALIGAGVAIKTFPIVVLLALLPTARRMREVAAAAAAAILVPAAVILPWLLADPRDVAFALSYRGGSGAGGLSLLVQPGLADGWFNAGSLIPSSTTRALVDAAPMLMVLSLATCTAVFVAARTPSTVAGLGIFLAGYVLGVNFFMQYAVWGLAFAAAAGWVRTALVVQSALVIPLIITYGARPWPQRWINVPYTAILDLLWVACAVALVRLLRREGAEADPSRAELPRPRLPAASRGRG